MNTLLAPSNPRWQRTKLLHNPAPATGKIDDDIVAETLVGYSETTPARQSCTLYKVASSLCRGYVTNVCKLSLKLKLRRNTCETVSHTTAGVSTEDLS